VVLKEEWPEDKDEYPFIVYALYMRRIESLETEFKWLTWFEDVLKTITGDVMHMSWGESRK